MFVPLGGMLGLIAEFTLIDPLLSLVLLKFNSRLDPFFRNKFQKAQLSPAHAKISFVSIWFAFAVALWILNKKKDRQVFNEISKNEKHSAEILVITGK